MATKVILLQRVEKLGNMGDVVTVKPGYARNFLLPQNMALRATNENIAYFEAQKKTLQADSDKQKADAEKLAEKLDGIRVPLIRQASEAGQLFGSVTSRDIAEAVVTQSGESVTRKMVDINRNFKMIGLFPVAIVLHPEVRLEVTVNIARTPEEAEIQAETGRALIADGSENDATTNNTPEEIEADLDAVLEAEGLAIEQDKAEAQAAQDVADAEAQAKADEKKAKKAEKADVNADEAVSEDAAATESDAE